MQSYIPRKLEYEIKDKDGNTQTNVIEDAQLLDIAQSKPVVILADAGMGKTLLIEQLEKDDKIKTKSLSATRLVRRSIESLKALSDHILLIDAFDEVPSMKDGSIIHEVLSRLEELNFPQFIVTCRSIEWNDSNKNEIQSDYTDILTATLTNLSREDAQQFLQSRDLASENVSQLITQLEENNLSSFYENPRNLALLAEIDFSVHPVPETKAELFELATKKLWQEVNPLCPRQAKCQMPSAKCRTGIRSQPPV